ncbi:glutamine amidotransferase [Hathewaya proteolytica DSM 3090]|uniref:Imidazole glycerol phosphate synthase subunit HisH n=1 Tax=Hathewaya proteolytica DSM 3090 TaxID=1121331 RepID=A0A1M6RH07_9CLOT|nr:imidazole glycerol phosphate synthase subunit HisH [Hathewaya proteolytica]SHK31647.1 glutamine amidotransferase [Hathewaya proteolytica DSM 3090]
MIVIIDYGMGNLKSVENALKKINCPCKISSKREDIISAQGLILPGVGAFYDCMKNLEYSGLVPVIKEQVKGGKPLLGICLGMQVLFERGFETEPCNGLGLFKGNIIKMEDSTVKIPHIGWNMLVGNDQCKYTSDVFNRLSKKPFVYYVHSFYVSDYCEEELVAYSHYGIMKVPGMFRKDNLMGCQFHPEKSGEDGLAILKYYVEEVVKCK